MCDESYCIIDAFDTKIWYKNNTKSEEKIYHRTDGPAIECFGGTKMWYVNGKRHREDGPAIDGINKKWFINDELHREDGPAVELVIGVKFWYIKNQSYLEDEYNRLIKLKAYF